MRNKSPLKKRPNNIGPWYDALTAEQRAAHQERATRAQWGPKKEPPKKADDGPWIWPFDLAQYDRSASLTAVEQDMLARYTEAYRFYRYGRTMDFGPTLDRLVRPLNDVFGYTSIKTQLRRYVLHFFLREMAERNSSFWGWTTEEWIKAIGARRTSRQHVVAVAYLLCDFSDLHRVESDHIVYNCLARKVFGREYVQVITDRVQSLLSEWGYNNNGTRKMIMRTMFELLLLVRSPHLEDLTLDHLRQVIARRPPRTGPYCIVALSRVLSSIGTIPEAMEIKRTFVDRTTLPSLTSNVPAEWARLCRIWLDRSSVVKHERNTRFYFLLNVGRWMAATHPEVTSPAGWTRNLAAEAVAIICRWCGGDWGSVAPLHVKSRGKILAPSTRASRISALRAFFRDLQDWELIPRRLDPARSFVTPKSLLKLIGPNPRTIADDVWAKLVWAGLNLSADDLLRALGKARLLRCPSREIQVDPRIDEH
jgi:hypothetical protein